MQLIAEEQDESDRNSIALLGYRDNTSDMVQKKKHPQSPQYSSINTTIDVDNQWLPIAKKNASLSIEDSVRSSNNQKKQILSLDQKCLSCSGQSSGLISTFKMACLAYAPTNINYRSTIYLYNNSYRHGIYSFLVHSL